MPAASENNPGKTRLSIADIRKINIKDMISGRDQVPPEEFAERGLQEAFAEVLAIKGVPFEVAFQFADAAWEIHKTKEQNKKNLPPPRKLSPEEVRELEQWLEETKEQREEERKAYLERLANDSEHAKKMRKLRDEIEQGEYFSIETSRYVEEHLDLPKLQIVSPEG